MRKCLLFAAAMVLGAMSFNSASGGFTAGANTNVSLLSTDYTSGGLVNKFVSGQMVTTPTDFTGTDGSVYSEALAAGSYRVYLVSATGSPAPGSSTFGVSFTNGEKIVGIAASNGWNGNLSTNVWGSHIGLQADVKSALEGLYGASSALDTTASASGVFGTGSQAIEIQFAGVAGNPDSYSMSDFALNGTVNVTSFGGVNGLNELSLVFTVVPEPTSLGLFGIGTLVFGIARLRRKKS